MVAAGSGEGAGIVKQYTEDRVLSWIIPIGVGFSSANVFPWEWWIELPLICLFVWAARWAGFRACWSEFPPIGKQ